MVDANPTRRDLLATLGRLAALGAGALALGGCESLLERIRNRPMRRALETLGPSDPVVQTYRDAVAAMRALPASNPRSWFAQADIHFNFCPHGNWYFLPWHRAYLLYFEQICRELTGNKAFALPYWNWTCNRRIPQPFLDATLPGGAANPLFEPGRFGVPPAALGDDVVGPALIDAILDEPNFVLFASDAAGALRPPVGYGKLEGTPHNTVHGFVGGVMSSFRSPRDPVFWMHHNMIERIWWDWNVVRGHANTNDPTWNNLSLGGMFVDGQGNPVNNVSVSLFNLAPLLSYRFDDVGITACTPRLVGSLADSAALRRLLEEGGRVKLERIETLARSGARELPVGRAASQALTLANPAALVQATPRGARRLLLRVLDVAQPATGDFFVRVYLNRPQADPGTGTDDPHYAGSFAFFNDPAGHGGHDHGAARGQAAAANAAFLVDLTPTLQRLRVLGRGADVTSVELVVVPQQAERTGRAAVLRIGGLELALVDSTAPEPRPFGEAPRK